MRETKFKKTEAGNIPTAWNTVALNELFDFGNGYTPSKAVDAFWNNGYIPWFRVDDIRANGNILSNSLQHITTEAVKGELFPANSFIISTSATVGEYAYVTVNYLANQRFVCLIKKSESIARLDDGYFLCLCESLGQWCRENCDQGSSFASVNMPSFRNHQIPLPPLSEQRKIAKALSDIDGLISSLTKLIEKKENIKKGTMQQLLTGKKRLEGFSEPWVEEKLGNILAYEQPTNYLVQSSKYVDGGTPVLTAGKTFILGYTNENFGIYTNLPVIIFDDFTTDSRFVKFPFKAKSSAMKMLKTKVGYDIRLVFELLQMIDYTPSDHHRHWIGMFANCSILVPPSLEEQTAIADILTSMDDEISALEQKREKYESIKKGMMQELLTGKIRLV